jgi:exopolyphosphatase/guanosine-5'-triphosphate,3'-diphosphate pyrophosphatase
MSQAPLSPDARPVERDSRAGRRVDSGRGESPCYAALDLGTNNCRLLIARPNPGGGFRIVEAYSRIVRLGAGLTAHGSLQDEAMDRALSALKICADRIKRRKVAGLRAIATQACRVAHNGEAFLSRVHDETGLTLEIITPKQEAQLSVAGCLNLFDRETAEAALVIDVGGGSTELSWIDLTDRGLDDQDRNFQPQRLPIRAWLSMPIGVVTLAEQYPEIGGNPEQARAWFRRMVDDVQARLAAFPNADKMRPVFDRGAAHMVGTSGAITSLAGLHLGLRRYDRTRVDGLWMSPAECAAVTERLLSLTPEQRALEPCIGPDRADLVLAGAAILTAVQELWRCDRARVADRGLREGLLLSLMSQPSAAKKRRRRRRRRAGAATQPAPAAA